MTRGEMKARVIEWMGESISDSLVEDAINDACESLWESVILAQLSLFFSGPVTASFASGAERLQLVSVVDPIVAPVLNQVAGGALPQKTLYAAITIATESGSETLPTPQSSLLRLVNQLLTVASPAYVANGFGYNVYAGDDPARLALQNDVPIPFGTLWTEPEDGIRDLPDGGPVPTENTTNDNVFYINHMEVKTPDNTFKAWNQADIDGELFRAFASCVSSSSPWQNYVFDLMNQRTIEVRPALGAALNPRYFFINKPRRIRFDNAQLPFQALPHQMFVRCFAISLLKLALDEYGAHETWDAKAERERLNIVRAIDQMNRPKNNRIVPFMT